MKRSADRILVTHAGSLVRPPEFRALIAKKIAGKSFDEAEYQAALTAQVASVVRLQQEAGIDIPSDGEYGKRGWTSYVTGRLNGIEIRPPKAGDPEPINVRTAGRDAARFTEFYAAYAPVQDYDWVPPTEPRARLSPSQERPSDFWECTGPISYKGAELKTDIGNFKAALAGKNFAEAFMPVAAPESARGVRVNHYYKDDDAFLAAMAEALRAEYRAIVDAGFLIQLDDAFLAHEYDRLLVTQSAKEVHKWFEGYVEMLNHTIRDIPEEKIRYHVCWGSWNGPHTSDIPLRDIVDLILKVKAQAYSLEAANPRHEHEFQVWQETKLPDGKIVIPGVVTHSTNIVEHPELIALRIKNFAKLVGRENVIAGTDCGFSQNWNTIRVHPSIQWAKLQSLAEGARLASKALWAK
ncbi:MAG TPA: cobalamin-independent methionine synthase II family protein [Stellaceae bacterium]|jgi:5-methyltetrahydropteroyltriglutamate--homocysteine methyltransferase|nr:cobalamin-independent methionine synthase II family protein [Stellaceae bacterium]